MKKFFTIFCLAATILVVNAQVTHRAVDVSALSKLKPAPTSSIEKNTVQSASRAATTPLLLDYDGNDNTYTTNLGYDYRGFLWSVNRNWGNTDNLNMDYAAVYFDTIQYVDQNQQLTFIPRSASTITLDSFGVVFIHENNTGTNDSITFTVWKLGTENVTNYGNPNSTFTTPAVWDTTIVTNQTIPLNTQNYTIATFFPNIAFAQGESFGVRVDFVGDTSNTFNVVAGYRDQCGDACFAEPAISGNNSAYYLNLTQGTSNFSGYFENLGGGIFYDCDQSGGYTAGGCELFAVQNFWIFSYVTVTADFGAAITADSLFTCPGKTLNLSAVGFGSTAAPFTYSWATTSGTLTSPTDQTTGLVLAGAATVTVTVTDAASQTVSASINIASRGINLAVTNSNPVVLACGGSVNITTSVTGTTTGRTYTWSTGATGGNAFSNQQVTLPGTYSVTVTNSSGCSATASANVVYPGGVTNTVSFTPPTPPVCKDQQVTFVNTSSNTIGWTGYWDVLGNGTLVQTNGADPALYTYSGLGFFPVTLTMDSANCKFKSTVRNVQVTNCVGIEDVNFENGITMLPNPSNGNVTITVNEVEKYLTVRVYNIIGSQVMHFNTNEITTSTTKNFDLSDLPNGTYLVKVETTGKTAIKRLVVSK